MFRNMKKWYYIVAFHIVRRGVFKMKWNGKDIELYIGAKEYVDTVIIPLIGISFKEMIRQSASTNEFTTILSQQIEQQFKGRVMLLPPLTYSNEWIMEEKIQLLLQWKETLMVENFKHIFFLTSDIDWKSIEGQLGDELLWTNSIPLEHLDEKYKQPMMDEQVKKILKVIINQWNK